MRILIIGIGDAFSRFHFGSSALIHAPAGYVLIDCPDPIHRALFASTSKAGWNIDAGRIDDIILTHLHGDHSNGIEMFGFFRRIGRLNGRIPTKPRLHVSRPVSQRLWQRLAPSMEAPMPFGSHGASTLEDYFDVRVLEPGRTTTIAGLDVDCRFTGHPVPTIGLLIHDAQTSFGWSADTPFERAHIDWLNQAGVFVHESNLGPSHTPIESLNQLPKSIRDKIRLIHLPDDFDPSQTDMRMLREGQVIAL
ncbi:MAG: MBL fold metallo-hydrolase [Phycisphaerales bacterium]|nr:MBL fold metallo-hydrolase [Phycisphaerales bacterium]MCI0674200.1 MBL fold metallo-hydrolase [Phycisphaerales bacterium]